MTCPDILGTVRILLGNRRHPCGVRTGDSAAEVPIYAGFIACSIAIGRLCSAHMSTRPVGEAAPLLAGHTRGKDMLVYSSINVRYTLHSPSNDFNSVAVHG